MDIGRIFCDIQHSDSECQRNFALYSVKKELKEQLSTTKIYKFLFGSNLLETVKTATAISKSSFDLKPDAPKKPKSNPTPSTSGKPLNWKTRTPARRQPPGPRSRHQQPAAQSATARGNSSQSYTQRLRPPTLNTYQPNFQGQSILLRMDREHSCQICKRDSFSGIPSAHNSSGFDKHKEI
ncbi:unnamed protein product [Colias eurytheme]|nr:unnamed protein product [Colias eurytheme]